MNNLEWDIDKETMKRINRFRRKHPHGSIVSNIIPTAKCGIYVTISSEDGKIISTAEAFGQTVESAENRAINNALFKAGY